MTSATKSASSESALRKHAPGSENFEARISTLIDFGSDEDDDENTSTSFNMISLLDKRCNDITPLINATRLPSSDAAAVRRRRTAKRGAVRDSETVAMLRPFVGMLREFIASHVNTLPEKLRADADAVQAHVMPVWRQLMANVFHRYDLTNDASECSEQCLHNEYTTTLYARTFLSCCWVHGYIHSCKKQWNLCTVRYTTREFDIICVHGGRSFGSVIGAEASCRGDKQTRKKLFDYYKSIESMNSIRSTAENTGNSVQGDIDRMNANFSATHTAAKDAKQQTAIAKPYLELIQQMECEEKQKNDAQLEAEREIEQLHEKLREARRKAEAATHSPPNARKRARRDDEISDSTSSAPERLATMATEKDLEHAEKRKKLEKRTENMIRKRDMYESVQVKSLREQALRVGGVSMRAVIMQVIEDIFFGEQNRRLYNRFMRGCAEQKARDAVRSRSSAELKRRSLISFSEVLNLLEHHNREYTEVIPVVERDTPQIERVYKRIRWLWETCNRSPFVRARVRYDETTKVHTVSPSGEDMCSLRQFTLAVLYYFSHGLTFSVPGSAHRDLVSMLCTEDSFAFELPPEKHVRFFGSMACEELERRIRNGLFTEGDFNPLDSDKTSIKPTLHGAVKERSRSRQRTRASSSTSVSMARSLSLEKSMNAVRNARKRRTTSQRRAATPYAALAAGERIPSLGSGRVVTSNGTSVTENQLTPYYMREPMLSGGSRTTKTGVYDCSDIVSARKFIRCALMSYGSRIAHLPGL